MADEVADLLLKYFHLVVKNGNFAFLMLELILADEVADLPPDHWHLVVKNGDFTFLLLELILADEVADLTPLQLSIDLCNTTTPNKFQI